jgi:Mg/Co/Ni transporter MgtE
MAKGINPAITPVQSFIRTPVVIAQDREDSSVVIERMKQHGVRRIPVVDEHSVVVGIVTSNDLLRVLHSEMTMLLDVLQKGQRNEQRQRR